MTLPSWWSWKGLLQHFIIGLAIVVLCDGAHAHHWLPVLLTLGLGIWHEWSDGDFSAEAGAPWNGVLDVAAFILPAFLQLWLL